MRISKLRASTFFWARSMERVTSPWVITSPSSAPILSIAEAILSRRFAKLGASLKRRLDPEREEGVEKLTQLGFDLFAPPDHGLYGFVLLPDGLNDMEVSHEAAQQGILLAPGSLFRVSGVSDTPSIRVNWSRVQDSRFYSFMRKLL